MFDNKRILITGASGFVGANLLRRILSTYPRAKPYVFLRKSSKRWRINDILHKVGVYELDLADKQKVNKAIAGIQPNIVFHLATYGAYTKQNSLDECIKTNIVGTSNIIQALDDVNYQVFVNTGSSSEYGCKSKPMRESDVLTPNSYYSATKASATYIANTYGILNNKPILTLRLFSVYGPYEEPDRFVPTVCLSAIDNKEINLVKGSARDFVYITDVVDAFLEGAKIKNFNNRIFNICTSKQTSIEFAGKLIKKLAKSKSRINIGSTHSRSWDTGFWVGDGRLVKKELKWQPKITLKEGLELSIHWFKANRKYYG